MKSSCWRTLLLVLLTTILLPGGTAVVSAKEGSRLRVCSDPNNLPYSSVKGDGFENHIARLLARELGADLEYYHWAQRRGFFRNTINAGRCDVVIGVPTGLELVTTTRPYYRSSYVFLQRRAAAPVRSLDDPALRTLKIAVQLIGDDFANAPPAHALARRGIVDNVVGFTVYGDYGSDAPQAPIVRAVESGEVDVAIVWGPLAGYYAKRARTALRVTQVSPLNDGDLPLAFSISAGVRRGDVETKQKVQAALDRRRREIRAVLVRFGVPMLTGE